MSVRGTAGSTFSLWVFERRIAMILGKSELHDSGGHSTFIGSGHGGQESRRLWADLLLREIPADRCGNRTTMHGCVRRTLAEVRDPRDPRGRCFSLVSLLLVTLCATAAGFGSYRAMAQWAAAAGPVELLHGPTHCPDSPSAAAIGRTRPGRPAHRRVPVRGGAPCPGAADRNLRARRTVALRRRSGDSRLLVLERGRSKTPVVGRPNSSASSAGRCGTPR